jgi:uncharacterized protein YgiM (DUF1202 family)
MRILISLLAATILIISAFGARVQSQNLESVLLDAAAAGQTDLVRSFLDHGANIEVKNKLGATPLIFASVKGHPQVVKLLLERGADVNVKTTTGITPLMAATTAGNAEAVKLLLEKGADASAKDQKGRTALDLAEATGATGVYVLLKSVKKTPVSVQAPAARPAVPAHTEIIRQGDNPTGLTVRAEPSPKGRVIAYLTVGSKVTYAGEPSNGWVKLSAPTAGGWVDESYLGSRNPEASVVAVDNPEQCLRVRNGPGMNHEKIGCLPKGAKLKLTGTVQKGWAQMVEPMAGWVAARQIQAPGLFPAEAATSGVQEERRAASGGRSHRRQKSENDFTQADKQFDREMNEFRQENEAAGSFQPGGIQPGRLLPVGPLGIGRFPF